ncbi:MAG: hypothetical protein DYG97_10160 [Ignavibacteria bacterium CHB3]|nr:hypothetical protein [Ignavibacteria bacterium CHB3]
MNSILGRVIYDVENCSGVLTADKKKLLKNLGVKKWDFSHYNKGRFDLISKKKLALMKKIIDTNIVCKSEFIPFNPEKKILAEKLIIEWGFK